MDFVKSISEDKKGESQMGIFSWKNRRSVEAKEKRIDSGEHEPKSRAEEMLDYPDLCPCDFDKTFEAWLCRLKRWGDFTITYKYPLLKINKKISQEKFIKDMTNLQRTNNPDPFQCENKSPVKVAIFREFLDDRRKKVREEYEFEMTRLNLKPGVKDVWTKKR